jgi:hypothetical protein
LAQAVLVRFQTQQMEMVTILFLVQLHQLMAAKALVIFHQLVVVWGKMVDRVAAVETQLAQEQLAKVAMVAQLLATHQLVVVVEKVAQVQHRVEAMAVMVVHHLAAL